MRFVVFLVFFWDSRISYQFNSIWKVYVHAFKFLSAIKKSFKPRLLTIFSSLLEL